MHDHGIIFWVTLGSPGLSMPRLGYTTGFVSLLKIDYGFDFDGTGVMVEIFTAFKQNLIMILVVSYDLS